MNYRAIVLLSGGVDSTTCLATAVAQYGADNVMALTLFYGQKHDRELQAAADVAGFYGVHQTTGDLAEVFQFSDCTLLSGRGDVAHESYADQLKKIGGSGAVATYVPFRNGLFLACAAAIAVSVHAEVIYYGAHADDAAGSAYPDCTPEFEEAMNSAIFEGSGRTVRLFAPLLHMNKAGVVELGLSFGAPYHLTWSCYEGGETPCGTCGTCIDRAAAFAANGIEDPAIKYMEEKAHE